VAVSWLIPVRNGRRWIGACVASALAECDDSDEVVVVDDGSSDAPEQACPDDPRIVWLRQPPEGIVAALERGRLAGRHPLIARLDADDLALPGRIAQQAALMASDSRLAVVGGGAQMVREDGADNAGMRAYVDWVNGLEDLRSALLVESPLFHPAVLMRAEAIAEVGGYRSGDFPEDYDLWLRLAGAGFSLASVSGPVVRIRDRPDRLTRADSRYRREAFEQLKRDWLAVHVIDRHPRLALWGAGKTGRRWLRWLLAEGHQVEAVIDGFGATSRQGVPVLPPSELVGLEVDLLLVAVGARGARDQIRDSIALSRPEWLEGRDWWCLA
jgi:glycosyltransferase involved in cell wall biosynthesis